MEQQYRLDVNKYLRNEMPKDNRFGFRKRMSALAYHFYIILFGEWINKEKYNRYVIAFQEMCKVDDERKKK